MGMTKQIAWKKLDHKDAPSPQGMRCFEEDEKMEVKTINVMERKIWHWNALYCEDVNCSTLFNISKEGLNVTTSFILVTSQ